MTAENYLQEKERLSQAMNGQDRLTGAVEEIIKALQKHNLELMPSLALDVTVFALETEQLRHIKLRDRRL